MYTIFVVPTRHYPAPCGTIIKCRLENDTELLYIQTSPDDVSAEWLPVSQFLEKCFSELLLNQEFMDECFRLYRGDKAKESIHVIDVIKDN